MSTGTLDLCKTALQGIVGVLESMHLKISNLKVNSQRTDLLPVYSFNGDGLWLAKTRTGNDKHVGHSSRLGPWRDVIARISDEYTR